MKWHPEKRTPRWHGADAESTTEPNAVSVPKNAAPDKWPAHLAEHLVGARIVPLTAQREPPAWPPVIRTGQHMMPATVTGVGNFPSFTLRQWVVALQG